MWGGGRSGRGNPEVPEEVVLTCRETEEGPRPGQAFWQGPGVAKAQSEVPVPRQTGLQGLPAREGRRPRRPRAVPAFRRSAAAPPSRPPPPCPACPARTPPAPPGPSQGRIASAASAAVAGSRCRPARPAAALAPSAALARPLPAPHAPRPPAARRALWPPQPRAGRDALAGSFWGRSARGRSQSSWGVAAPQTLCCGRPGPPQSSPAWGRRQQASQSQMFRTKPQDSPVFSADPLPISAITRISQYSLGARPTTGALQDYLQFVLSGTLPKRDYCVVTDHVPELSSDLVPNLRVCPVEPCSDGGIPLCLPSGSLPATSGCRAVICS